MKIGSNQEKPDVTKIKVQINDIKDDMIYCSHVVSGYKIKAFIKKDMHLEKNQVVLLEFRRGPSGGGGYIVVDELMETVEAEVLGAQHMIANNMMYTSIILQNLQTGKRMHSLVPSNNALFRYTNVIMTGDRVRIKLNNGNIVSIDGIEN